MREAYGDAREGLGERFARAGAPAGPEPLADDVLGAAGLFAPLVAAARAQVADRSAAAGLSGAAEDAAARALLTRLVQICARTLHAEYAAFSALHRMRGDASAPGAFVAAMASGGILRVFAEYPVLARLCGTAAALWVAAIGELTARLAADRGALGPLVGGRTLGPVEALRCDLSDPHEGGRSVVILEFGGGVRVVYKPRSLALERFYEELLAWLRVRGLALDHRTPRVVERDGYGWLEFVERAPCDGHDGVRRFYERAGTLLCVANLLNASDFHYENLIAAGEHPVLLDMEGLIGHRFTLAEELPTPGLVATQAARRVLGSVLGTRMLPTIKEGDGGVPLDVGAMPGVPPAPILGDAHLPHVDGAAVGAPAHVDAIVAGFAAAYDVFAAHREALLGDGGPLAAIAALPTRFILRNTSLYSTLLQRCLHPSFLRDGVDRSIQLDVLARPLLSLGTRPVIWPALAAERDALEQLDIPLFTGPVGGAGITLPDGGAIADCFAGSALDEVRTRVLALGPRDRADQVRAIRCAYETSVVDGLQGLGSHTSGRTAPAVQAAAEATTPANASDLVAAAAHIAELVLAHALPAEDGSLGWLSAAYLPRARRFTFGAAAHHVFDGYGGVALLAAGLARLTGARRWRDVAGAALVPLRRRLPELERAVRLRRGASVGVGVGLGSAVYTLVRCGTLLGDPAMLADAERVADWLTPDLVAAQPHADVLVGGAGALLALLAVGGTGGAEWALARSAEVGAVLLARGRPDVRGRTLWASTNGRVEAGFAHGQAGIACALLRLGAVTGRDDFTQAALSALGWEAERTDAELASATRLSAWSDGATGVGLACLAAPAAAHYGGPTAPLLARAVRLTRDALGAGPDTAGHGDPGRLDLLLAAGAVEEVRCVAARLAVGARPAWREDAAPASLFVGTAGVAYQLLRAADPSAIPSVLSFA